MVSGEEKYLTVPLRISVAVAAIGILLRILHLEGANLVVLAGFVAIIPLYTFRFYKKQNKLLLDYIKIIFVLSFCVNRIFLVLHLSYREISGYISMTSFVLWLCLEGNDYVFGNKEGDGRLVNFVFSSATMAVILITVAGIIFKILHIAYADVLLVIGVIGCSLWILRELFQKRSQKGSRNE
jgi:hypothetical protein